VADRSITSLGYGVFIIPGDDDTRRRAWAVRDRQATWVFIAGRVYRIEPDRSSRHTASGSQGSDEAALSSPMPATVSAVKVKSGDRVSKGDVLVTLEAMKMELPIRAPRDGVVRRIACAPGELVQPGIPLVVLD
jgi:biotin carboxyl carrier protein